MPEDANVTLKFPKVVPIDAAAVGASSIAPDAPTPAKPPRPSTLTVTVS
jgi:hypothetical protein